MTRRSLSALILLNAVLLAGIVLTVFSKPAVAQFGGGSNYMMIAGQATGRTSQDAVYIVELSSSRIAAVMFNSSNDRLEPLAGRVIADDMARRGGGR